MIDVKDIFLNAARRRVLADTPFRTVDDKRLYFGDDYKQVLIADMKKRRLYERYKDLEFVDYGKGRTKICKITSSSRLCYLYFTGFIDFDRASEECVLEEDAFSYQGDNGKYTQAHFDCRRGSDFYETKCEEFFHEHDQYLLAHFYKKLLAESFDLDGVIPESNGNLFPTLEQFGIHNYEGSVYSLRFDMKQLLTHLLALAHRKQFEREPVTLNYIWFVPSQNDLEEEELNRFEKGVFDEFCAIKEAPTIKRFCLKHGITLTFKREEMPKNEFRKGERNE